MGQFFSSVPTLKNDSLKLGQSVAVLSSTLKENFFFDWIKIDRGKGGGCFGFFSASPNFECTNILMYEINKILSNTFLIDRKKINNK